MIAAFSTGTAAASIKVDPAGQSYGVVWQVPATLALGRLTHRVQVFDGSTLLGYADLSIVARQSDTKSLPASEVGAVRGSPLHIKFRIERSTVPPIPPAVIAQLSVGGGRVDVPLGGGAQLTLTIPDGALKEPMTVTITPKAPKPGVLGVASISPTNILFNKAIGITLTSPATLAPDDAKKHALILRTPPSSNPLILPTTHVAGPNGHVYTASTPLLGNPHFDAPAPGFATTARLLRASLSASAAETDSTEIAAELADIAAAIASYRARAEELEATLQFEAALQLRLAAGVLLQFAGTDPTAGAEVDAARAAACGALDKHLTLAPTRLGAEFSNLWSALRPMLAWASATADLGVGADNCPAAAEQPAMLSDIVTQFTQLYTNAMKREAFKQNADALGYELWEALRAREIGRLLGLDAEFAQIKSLIQLPLAMALRKASYDWCRTDLEHLYSGRLLRAARDRGMFPPGIPELARLNQPIQDPIAELGYDTAALWDDVHYCGTDVQATSKRKNGALTAEATLGGGAQPGELTLEQTVAVSPEGTVEFGGALLAFMCPDGTVGNDRVIFEFNGVIVWEISPAGVTNEFIRTTPAVFDVRALAQAASVSASDGGKFPLRIYRTSNACAGEYNRYATTEQIPETNPRLLATLQLQFPTITVTVLPGSVSVQPGQTAQFGVLVTGDPNTTVTWSATGGTISFVGTYTAGAILGTFTVTATSVADPAKSSTATVSIQIGTTPPPGSQFTMETVGTPQFDQPLKFRLTVVSIPAVNQIQWTTTATTSFPAAGDLNPFIDPTITGPTDVDQFTRRWEVSVTYPRTWFRGIIGYNVTVTVRACGLDNGVPVLNTIGQPLCVQKQVIP